MTITNEELEEAQKLCDAATPGPWKFDEECQHLFSEADATIVIYARVDIGYTSQVEWMEVEAKDAEFIAKSRELIPKLLAEIQRLKGENEKAICFMRDTKREHYPTTTNSFADDFIKNHETHCDGRCKNPRMARP